MGYHDRCTSCYGAGIRWDDAACRRCGGSGKSKPYRRALTMVEGEKLGWSELVSFFQRRVSDKHCVVCSALLPGRRKTFCSDACERGYMWRVWKGAHWQKRAVANRDGAACKRCGEVFERPIVEGGPDYPDFAKLQLDHIRPLHLGGTEHPENCQLLCEDCHKAKSARERSAPLFVIARAPAAPTS